MKSRAVHKSRFKAFISSGAAAPRICLEAGVHLAEVQRILGHCVIATTVRYVHIADPQRRAAIELHPINAVLLSEQEVTV
jgi:hypothetical protein